MDATSKPGPARTIGKYTLVAKIADGTMGSVFKGHETLTGAAVAIKVPAAELLRDPVLLKRFEQEFRAASHLDHPNIVRALDFGWQGGRPYLVMELVDGEDLWTRIERLGRLPEAEAVHYIVQVAQGLHEAHKHGIIHRDVKPDNILLTASGQAKLADLGLSKDLEAELELTRPDKGLGTPNFIAPEQFGDARHAGVRCDVYSLGATLYMALTGAVPFQACGLAEMLNKKVANDLPAPRSLVAGLSEHVDWAVRRAVLAEAERRFASCAEFMAALAGPKGGGEDGAAREPSWPARRAATREWHPAQERRASVRYDCSLQTACSINPSVHVDDTDGQTPWDAQVCNLSVSGIGLLLARRFEPGTILMVDLRSRDGAVQRTLEMRVLRVAEAEKGSWYLGGTLAEKLRKEELRRLL